MRSRASAVQGGVTSRKGPLRTLRAADRYRTDIAPTAIITSELPTIGHSIVCNASSFMGTNWTPPIT